MVKSRKEFVRERGGRERERDDLEIRIEMEQSEKKGCQEENPQKRQTKG